MMVLWRQIHVIETDDGDDGMVIAEIKELKKENRVECDALKELCEMHGADPPKNTSFLYPSSDNSRIDISR